MEVIIRESPRGRKQPCTIKDFVYSFPRGGWYLAEHPAESLLCKAVYVPQEFESITKAIVLDFSTRDLPIASLTTYGGTYTFTPISFEKVVVRKESE